MLIHWTGSSAIAVPLDNGSVATLMPLGTYNIPKSCYDTLLAQSPGDIEVVTREEGIIPGVTEWRYYVPSSGEILDNQALMADYVSENPTNLVVPFVCYDGGTPNIGGLVENNSFRTESATTTLLTTDNTLEFTGASSFALNLMIPAGETGNIFYLKNSGTGTITITPTADVFIDGASTLDMIPGEAYTITSTGTNRIIL